MNISHFTAAIVLAAATTTGVASAQGADHILAHDPNPTVFTDMAMAKSGPDVDKAYVRGMTMMMNEMHMMAKIEMARGSDTQVRALARKELMDEHDLGDPLASTRQRFFPNQMTP